MPSNPDAAWLDLIFGPDAGVSIPPDMEESARKQRLGLYYDAPKPNGMPDTICGKPVRYVTTEGDYMPDPSMQASFEFEDRPPYIARLFALDMAEKAPSRSVVPSAGVRKYEPASPAPDRSESLLEALREMTPSQRREVRALLEGPHGLIVEPSEGEVRRFGGGGVR